MKGDEKQIFVSKLQFFFDISVKTPNDRIKNAFP